MIRKQSVKPSRLAHYEKTEIKGVSFELAGESLKALTLETALGPLTISLESYSLSVYETAMRKVFRATVTDTMEVFPPLEKDFEDKYERDEFVSNFDMNNGRFDVAISEFEEAATA